MEWTSQHLRRLCLCLSLVPARIGRQSDEEAVAQVELINDLRAAVEVNSSEGRRVLYPGKSLKFERPLDVGVSLRDDPSIRGTCKEVTGKKVFTSSGAFGKFGIEAQNFIEKEDMSVQREHQLQEVRTQGFQNKLMGVIWGHCRWILCIWAVLLVFLVACAIVPPESYAIALLLGPGAGCLCCCTCNVSFFWIKIIRWKIEGAENFFEKRLCQGEASTGLARSLERSMEYLDSPVFERQCLYLSFVCCLCVLVSVSLPAMTVMYCIRGFPRAAALLWPPVLLGLACIVGIIISPFRSTTIGEMYVIVANWLIPENFAAEAKTQAAYDMGQHTIVFEGNVLPCKPCVCSWPGKYESAWDALVRASRRGHLSAAVVFLPEGSRHSGIHDAIPAAEKLQGDCWCTPLYGERKWWGCRWWTHWIANIEEAVHKGAELQVYFFHKMKGKGKVESFATAGEEHLRRERVLAKKSISKGPKSF